MTSALLAAPKLCQLLGVVWFLLLQPQFPGSADPGGWVDGCTFSPAICHCWPLRPEGDIWAIPLSMSWETQILILPLLDHLCGLGKHLMPLALFSFDWQKGLSGAVP